MHMRLQKRKGRSATMMKMMVHLAVVPSALLSIMNPSLRWSDTISPILQFLGPALPMGN